ncbi:uroporphyrinogen-III synthase [Roseomonas sp. KE0001]|uniref:uroporphyrinogen-III synthase n=1 Tax=Roseomonas sp. KE0001 TaxID=2479201 RepID=UPI0018E05304
MREPPAVLVTRPEPGCAETAAAVAALGWRPLLAPALVLSPLPLPADIAHPVQALLLPSRAAARALAGALDPGLPVLAVGPGTAAEAEAAGFRDVRHAEGEAESLVVLARARLRPRQGALLLAAGRGYSRTLAAALRDQGFAVRHRAVYAARPATALPPETLDALRRGRARAALFLSPRSAQVTQRLLRRAGLAETVRGMVALALSQRIAQSLAGMPWRAIRATPAPDSLALLALLGRPAPGMEDEVA